MNWTPTPRLELLSSVSRVVDHTALPARLIGCRSVGLIIMKKRPSNGGATLQEMKAPEGLTLWISPSIVDWVVKTVTGHLISIRGCNRLSTPRVISKSSRQRGSH